MAFVYKADPVRGAEWQRLAAWLPPADIGRQFAELEVLFSTGAGVDPIDLAALPPELPVVRFAEPGSDNVTFEGERLTGILDFHFAGCA